MAERSLVIGIGNPDRGDDGAGALVVELLRGRLPVLAQRGDMAALLDALDGVTHATLVDASSSGAPSGSVRRFDLGAAPLPAHAAPLARHGLGLGEALELARALGRLPPRCTVYTIEGSDFAAGAAPGAAVRAAAAALAERIAHEHASASVRACTSAA